MHKRTSQGGPTGDERITRVLPMLERDNQVQNSDIKQKVNFTIN